MFTLDLMPLCLPNTPAPWEPSDLLPSACPEHPAALSTQTENRQPKKKAKRLKRWHPDFNLEAVPLPEPAELPAPPPRTESHSRNPIRDRHFVNYTGEPLRLSPGQQPPPFDPSATLDHLLRLPLAKVGTPPGEDKEAPKAHPSLDVSCPL